MSNLLHAVRFTRGVVIGFAICAMLPVSAALAQDQSDESDSLLEEVIVTARYREATVQDLGLSLRAFGQDELNRLGIQDMNALARFTPSLNIQERGPNRNEMNIRGVSNLLVTQDLVPSSRPVGIYLDESPVNTLGGSQFDIRLYDMERVEVLRGPQGTLFGEGASAGAVRYFTRNPSLTEFEGNVEVEAVSLQDGGSDFNARAAISIPLAEDTVGLRLVAGTYNYPGWVNVVGGKKNVNDVNAKLFRAVLLAKPSDNFTLRAMVHYDDSKVGSLGMYTGDVDDRSALLPLDDDRIDDENLVANLKMDWNIGNGTITSLTSYFDRDRRRQVYDQIYSVVNSLSTVPLFGIVDESFLDDTITQNQWSQELRYVSDFDGPFQFTIGGFYKDFKFTTRDVDVCSTSHLLLGFPAECFGDIFDALGLPNPAVVIENKGKQLSAFFEAEFSVNENFRIIGGLRWHNEDLDVFSPAAGIILGPGFVLPLPEVSETITIDALLPKVALEWDVNKDMLAYAQYSTGARNGNINSTSTLATMEIFAPGSSVGFEGYEEDRTETFEIGLKSQFAGGRGILNTAAWYTDYSDLQVVIAVPPLGFGLLLNASKAVSKGAEFDFNFAVNENFDIFAGGSYTKSTLDEPLVSNLITGATLPKGTPLPFAPEWSFNGGGEYRWPLSNGAEIYLNGNAAYTGEYKNGLSATITTNIPSHTIFGAGLGYRTQAWSVDFYVSNLTDENQPVAINNFDPFFVANVGPVPPGFTFNEQFMLQPRSYRLAFRYWF